MQAGIVYMALAYVCWGLFPLYFRQLQAVPALEIIMHRTVWSLLFILVILLVRRRWDWLWPVLRSGRLLAMLALSAFLLSANWLIYVWAVNHGHVIDASLGYFILPLMNIGLGVVFLRERPRLGQWLSMGIAAVGVLWLTWLAGQLPWIGLALALSFGFYGLLRKTAVLGSLEGLALETALLAPIASVALAWWGWQGQAAWVDAPPGLWLWLLAAGPFTAIPLLLFAAGARRISMTSTGALQYIGPTLQFLCGVWLFNETVDAQQLLGFVAIWSALVVFTVEGIWVQRHKRRML